MTVAEAGVAASELGRVAIVDLGRLVKLCMTGAGRVGAHERDAPSRVSFGVEGLGEAARVPVQPTSAVRTDPLRRNTVCPG